MMENYYQDIIHIKEKPTKKNCTNKELTIVK